VPRTILGAAIDEVASLEQSEIA